MAYTLLIQEQIKNNSASKFGKNPEQPACTSFLLVRIKECTTFQILNLKKFCGCNRLKQELTNGIHNLIFTSVGFQLIKISKNSSKYTCLEYLKYLSHQLLLRKVQQPQFLFLVTLWTTKTFKDKYDVF